MAVRVSVKVGQALGSIHGVGEFGLEVRLKPDVEGLPGLLTTAVDSLYGDRGWNDLEEAPLGFPDVSPLPAGASLWFDWVDDTDALISLIDDLAHALTAAGLDGQLAPVRSASTTKSGPPTEYKPCLTAGIALRLDADAVNARNGARGGWYVDPDTTSRVIGFALDWVQADDQPTLYFHNGTTHSQATREQLDDLMSTASLESSRGGLHKVIAMSGSRLRRLDIDAFGHLLFEIRHTPRTWRTDLESLTGVLMACAPDARYGFVRRAKTPSHGYDHAVCTWAPRPHVEESFQLSAPLIDTLYVPDVYGVQLLNTEHLSRIDGLDGWETRQIGDMTLVSTGNPSAWFDKDGDATPEPDVYTATTFEHEAPSPTRLAAARRQFADALMTTERVRELQTQPYRNP